MKIELRYALGIYLVKSVEGKLVFLKLRIASLNSVLKNRNYIKK